MAAIKHAIRMTLAKIMLRFFPDTKLALACCLQSLSELSLVIFNCYLTRDYAERHYFYEKLFHEKRRDFLYAMTKLRRKHNVNGVVLHVENAYEIVLSLGLLLYRISDHSIFEAAGKEFYAIAENITACFRDLSVRLFDKNQEIISDSLTENIQQLEEVYQGALTIVLPDPLVFLLFLQDLSELNALFAQLSLDINRL